MDLFFKIFRIRIRGKDQDRNLKRQELSFIFFFTVLVAPWIINFISGERNYKSDKKGHES